MDKNCSNWERLPNMVTRFKTLKSEDTANSCCVEELYKEIRDLCLIKVYTQPSIRKILDEEELSGFLLHFESKFRRFVENFDETKCPFLVYLTFSAEFCAYNYLAKKTKETHKSVAIVKELGKALCIDELEENWDRIDSDIDNNTASNNLFRNCDRLAVEALKFLCYKRKSFQKRIFIFMCTMLPFLDTLMIEHLCQEFNFNVMQTFAINEYLFDRLSDKDKHNKRMLYIQKRNANWATILSLQEELAAEGMFSLEEETKELLKNKIEIHKNRRNLAKIQIDKTRKKVPYPIISNLLNIPEGTVASTVYTVSNVMKAILLAKQGVNIKIPTTENGLYSMVLDALKKIKKNKLTNSIVPHFYPFEEFNITCKTSSQLNCLGK